MAEGVPTAWGDPTWVLAVMHYPADTVLLERIATDQPITARRDTENQIQTEAARAGKVAGNVLAALYALDQSPWRIAEPSLARAIHVAEQLAYADRNRGAPRGHTKIENCYNAMRSVAHLWAAYRLHWEYPAVLHDELILTADGIRILLQIAQGVQKWALTWKPARTKRATPLLGESPWLVPAEFTPLRPPWTTEPTWLLKAADSYKRRTR